MQFNPGFSSLAALLADPGRAQMIWALMDGSARPASELALLAGVSPSSASGHLGRLVEGGVLSLEARGRNRFYRLAGPEVGQAVEALASASWPCSRSGAACRRVTARRRRCARRGPATTTWPANSRSVCSHGCWMPAGSSRRAGRCA